jgi:hypothetical protein
MDLTGIYRVFPLANAKCMVFSAVQGASFKIDHILVLKASVSKYRKVEITPYILQTIIK